MAKTRAEDEFLKFYYNRWRSSELVGVMGVTARGCYWELLIWQFHSDKGSVPADGERCRQLIGADNDEWAKFAPFFDEAFPMSSDGRRVNDTMASARAERDAARARGLSNGNQGGRPSEPKPTETETKHKPNNNLLVNQNKSCRLTEEEVEEEEELEREREKPPDANASRPQGQNKRFVKPTLEELKTFMAELGLPPETPQAFLDHHEARGWKLNRGVPMTDWRAACRTWKRVYDQRQVASPNGKPPVMSQAEAARLVR